MIDSSAIRTSPAASIKNEESNSYVRNGYVGGELIGGAKTNKLRPSVRPSNLVPVRTDIIILLPRGTAGCESRPDRCRYFFANIAERRRRAGKNVCNRRKEFGTRTLIAPAKSDNPVPQTEESFSLLLSVVCNGPDTSVRLLLLSRRRPVGRRWLRTSEFYRSPPRI